VIADIHGNLVSLQAVLDDARVAGVERVVCLGDVAATGPQPAEALEAVAALGCDVVMGNADEWLLDPEPTADDLDVDNRRIVEIDSWAREQLTPQHLALIERYRPMVELDGLLCFHGTPRSNTETLLPTTPDHELDRMLDGRAAPVMAGGHTHIAMLRRHGPSLIVNPGSVGMPFEAAAQGGGFRNPPWAEYAIVDGTQVEFRRVPVDVGAVTAAAFAAGMPHAGWWVRDWAWS
jgi:predicted phosphodiesterase